MAACLAASCRCGSSQTSDVAQPSNEQTGIAYGLDWLPGDTTIVARFAPGYGPLADYLEATPNPPECVAPLLQQVTATYMVHRYIADPPVTVIEGSFERDEVEQCVGVVLGGELRRDEEDIHLTSFAVSDRAGWLGWGEGRVLWHDELERVVDVLYATDRISESSRLTSLLVRLPKTGAGVVGTVDLTSPVFGVSSTGFVARWQHGQDGDDRLLFASADDAAALIAEKARRAERGKNGLGNPGYMGDAMLWRWDIRQDDAEVHAPIAIAARHPIRLIRFAEFFAVPTRPE